MEESRSRFVIHIRVSEDKAIKSPRASGCGADSPGLPRRIKLTDPPGTQRGERAHEEKAGSKGRWMGEKRGGREVEVVGSNERKILYFL